MHFSKSRNCIGLVLHKKREGQNVFPCQFLHKPYKSFLKATYIYLSQFYISFFCSRKRPCDPYQISLYRYPAAKVFAYGTFLFDPALSQNIPTAHDGTPYAESSFNLSRKKFVTDQKMLNAIRDRLILPSSIHAPSLRRREIGSQKEILDHVFMIRVERCSDFDDCWLLCSWLVHHQRNASDPEIPFNFFVILQFLV